MVCGACKQFGGAGMPLSYVNPSYREPSAYAGSNRVFSEPLLARPSLDHTGGRRSRKIRKARKTRRRGGFYPSVMSKLIVNGSRIVPVAAVTGYRMVKNYKKKSTRRHRK